MTQKDPEKEARIKALKDDLLPQAEKDMREKFEAARQDPDNYQKRMAAKEANAYYYKLFGELVELETGM